MSVANVEVALDYAYLLPSASGGTVANQVPQFTKGVNLTVSEDSAAVINNARISSSSPGAGEEWQTLSYLVSNNNTALFSVAPAISPAGTLTFQPAANASGLAEVTVRVQDNGGTANGGIDTSPPQTFFITVTPVNDPPVAIGDSLYAHSQVTSAFPAAGLLANDMDVDGDLLDISSVTSPSAAGAVVSLAGAVVNYDPPVNHAGADSFQYTVVDGKGGASSAQVSVTVVRPEVTAWSATGGMLRLEFKGIPNRAYQLQTSENLGAWSDFLTPVTNTLGTLLWEMPITEGEDLRFYRFKW